MAPLVPLVWLMVQLDVRAADEATNELSFRNPRHQTAHMHTHSQSNVAKVDSPADAEVRQPLDPKTRLGNVMNWLATAKQNLPAVSDGTLGAHRVAEASALVDRMHKVARALERRMELTTREAAARDARADQVLVAQHRRAA